MTKPTPRLPADQFLTRLPQISVVFHVSIAVALAAAFLGQLNSKVAMIICLSGVGAFLVISAQSLWRSLTQSCSLVGAFTRYRTEIIVLCGICLYLGYLALGADYQYQLARDGGIYSTTAMNLNDSGTLQPIPHVLFKARSMLLGTSAINVESGYIEFQGSHGASVAYALASFLVGIRWMVAAAWIAAVLTAGHLMRILYALGCRKGIALSAVASFFLGLPLIDNLRTTYSEIFLLAAIVAVVDIVITLVLKVNGQSFLSCGILIGLASIYRADAPLFVGLSFVGITLIARADFTGSKIRALGLAALPGMVLGWVDLQFWSTEYAEDLGHQFRNVLIASVAGFLFLLAGSFARDSSRTLLTRWTNSTIRFIPMERVRVALPWLLGSIVALIIFGGLMAPLFYESASASPKSYVADIEAREGILGNGSRSYNEFNFRSVPWYWGQMWYALFPASFGWIVFRVAHKGHQFWAALACLSAWAFFYVPNNRITPDHLFATRRWISGFFPFVLVIGALLLSHLVDRSRESRKAILSTMFTSALLIPVVVGAFQYRSAKVEYGAFEMLEEICSTLPDSADVVLTRDVRLMTPTLRYGCGVEAGWLEDSAPRTIAQQSTPTSRASRAPASFVLATTSTSPSELFPGLAVLREWRVVGEVADGHFTTLSRPVRDARPSRSFSISFFELEIPSELRNLQEGTALVLLRVPSSA